MNWNQLYNLATPEERLEAIVLMVRVLKTRRQRRVFAYGRLIVERRRAQAAHWISDRRGRFNPSRAVIMSTFLFILLTVSTATGLFVMNAPVEVSGPVLFFYATSLLSVLVFKPSKYSRSIL